MEVCIGRYERTYHALWWGSVAVGVGGPCLGVGVWVSMFRIYGYELGEDAPS